MRRSPVTSKGISFCSRHECHRSRTYEIAERLSPHWLQDLKVDSAAMGELRGSLGGYDLGLDVSRMDDNEVIARFVHLLDGKSLCRRDARQDDDSVTPLSTDNQKQNAAESVIRVLSMGDRPFSFEARTLRVIRTEDWRRAREDGRHQIVPTVEARETILKLVALPATTPQEKKAWQKALDLLPEAGSGRVEGGLLLLRVVPTRNFKSPSAEPAITPSQLARLLNEKHWIEIELVDEAGAPVAGVNYSIVTPDNQEFTGVTDEAGVARLDNIPAGQCQISFPELDKEAYKAA